MDVVCNISELNSPFPGSHKICPTADIVGWAFSVATNIACTVLIGFKAWYVHNSRRHASADAVDTQAASEENEGLEYASNANRKNPFATCRVWFHLQFIMGTKDSLCSATKPLTLSFQLSQVIAYTGFSTVSPWHWVYEVLDPMGNQIAGMYPTLIIVIVNFKRTAWEEASSHSHSGTSSNPRFKRSGPAERFSYHRHGGVSIQLETVIEMDNIVKSNDKEHTHL
jgi:hypothetical protein